jgi:transcriptional regulator with XRE-family HTH domain
MTLLGARIRSLREDLDLDVGQLAYKAQIHRSTIHKIENGDRPNTSGVILSTIADALNTTTDYLLGRTNDPSPQTRPAGVDSGIIRMAYEMIDIWQELARVSPDLLEQAVDLMATQTELLLAAASRRRSSTGAENGAPCTDANSTRP